MNSQKSLLLKAVLASENTFLQEAVGKGGWHSSRLDKLWGLVHVDTLNRRWMACFILPVPAEIHSSLVPYVFAPESTIDFALEPSIRKGKEDNKKLSGFPYISIAINIYICMFSLALFFFLSCVDKSLKTACWLPMDLFWIWCELMSLDIFDVWFTTTCREENYILVLQSNKTKQLGLRSDNSCLMAGCFARRESQDSAPLQGHLHCKNLLHVDTSTIWPGLQTNSYLGMSNRTDRKLWEVG